MTEKSQSSIFRNKVLAYLGLIAAEIALLHIRVNTHLGPIDDAYMTWRGASNLANGLGFVYNIGEKVQPTSTPLYAILLAAINFITGIEPLNFFRPLNFSLDALTILFFWDLLRRGNCSTGMIISGTLSFALSLFWAMASLQGMETPLTLFFLVLSCWSLSQRRFVLCSGFAGLLCVTRPEGVLFAGIISAMYFHRLSGKAYRPIILLFLPLAIWEIISISYFGVIIPQSVIAKSIAYIRDPGIAFLNCLHAIFIALSAISLSFIAWSLALLGFALCLGVPMLRKQNQGIQALPVFTLALLLFYGIANPFMFFWYAVPLVPGTVLLLQLAIESVAQLRIAHHLVFRILVPTLRLIPISVAFHYWIIPSWFILTPADYPPWLTIRNNNECEACSTIENQYRFLPGSFSTLGTVRREEVYQEIAQFIIEKYATTQEQGAPKREEQHIRVLAPEFGALGYNNRLHLISSLGHVNPEVLKYLPVRTRNPKTGNIDSISKEMLQGINPDLIVAMNSFMETLLADPWFHENYTLIKEFTGDLYGPKPILVLARTGFGTP